MGSTVPADGYSRPYLAAVAYGSALYGFLAILISAFVSEDLVFDGDGARAFYEGYRSRMHLSDAENAILFDASLFHALRYLVWANPEVRLRRIRWAIAHRARLESVLS